MSSEDGFLAALEASTVDVNEAITLPPACYTSEEFLAFERQAIFERDWLCIGHEGQIPNVGDYFCVQLFEEPLVAVRGTDDLVRVMSSVCRHRGMVVAEGSGHGANFRCPYHFWVYGLDGQLLGAPAMEQRADFDKSCLGLPQLKTEFWNGFIFVSFNDEAPPLVPTLGGLDGILRNYHLSGTVWIDGGHFDDLPWNWKVMLENFVDGYHNNRLHSGIGDVMPCSDATFVPFDPERDNHISRSNRTLRQDASFNLTREPLFPVFPHLSTEDRWHWNFALVPPMLALAIVPDQVAYFTIFPNGANSISIQIGYLFHPKVVEMPMFDVRLAQAKADVDNFNGADIHADTMVQVGLRSRFAPRGPYSWQEATLQQINSWLVKRYRDHYRRDPAPVRAAGL
ncbi:MAG: aromatic ring-hydroxylating dioxygenase subunit alpha [Acidimicrobiia bacterium]|nr:aromatic ring-hydroxylating dioxygenase subunit alpha [Acidimicrobiia bacterium]